jgi:hypothetical protein
MVEVVVVFVEMGYSSEAWSREISEWVDEEAV